MLQWHPMPARRAEPLNLHNMSTTISVSQALQRIAAGQPVSGYTIDFERIKIEALDVMKLAKAGFDVPEEAIYYDDDDIAYDEDFEGDWQRVPTGSATPSAEQTVVSINLPEETRQWIAANHVNLDHLLTNLLDSFYRAQKMVTDKS